MEHDPFILRNIIYRAVK